MKYPTFLTDFIGYLETIKGVSNLTVKEYTYDIILFLKFLKLNKLNEDPYDDEIFYNAEIFDVPISDLDSVSISTLYSFMSYLDKHRKTSNRTRNRKTSSLRTFYEYLTVKTGLISNDPTKKLEFSKARPKNPIYLTLDEAKSLLSHVKHGQNEFISSRDFAIITLFLNCGLRLSELTSINLNMIKGDILSVVGKGNKERTIYLNESSIEAINYYKLSRKKYLEDRKVENIESIEALFISERLTRMSNRAIQHRIEKYIKEIGLDPNLYTVHKLRHTAATLLYKYGEVDIRTLQVILGHESVATTQIYTHLDDSQIKKAVDKNPLNYK